MKNEKFRVRCVYANGAWKFVDEAGNKIEFDQAVIKPIYQSANVVEGYVVSVHGISQEVAQHFDSELRSELGVVYPPRPGLTRKCVRLMPGGVIESVDFERA